MKTQNKINHFFVLLLTLRYCFKYKVEISKNSDYNVPEKTFVRIIYIHLWSTILVFFSYGDTLIFFGVIFVTSISLCRDHSSFLTQIIAFM